MRELYLDNPHDLTHRQVMDENEVFICQFISIVCG